MLDVDDFKKRLRILGKTPSRFNGNKKTISGIYVDWNGTEVSDNCA